jgi:hypothetical protein
MVRISWAPNAPPLRGVRLTVTEEAMHYILGCEPGRPIVKGPDVDEPWTDGRVLQLRPVEPLVYTLDGSAAGEPAAMYDGIAPVWSDDLCAALREAGADNLEAYKAVLRDPQNRREWPGYCAVNVIGLVAAVDLERSGLTGSAEERGDLDPGALVLDEEATEPFRLFRLAESPDLVIVDERVREAVERRRVPGVLFVRPGLEE